MSDYPPAEELLSFLGEQCSRIYSRSPHVRNELINRRVPSSAAVAARTKLSGSDGNSPEQTHAWYG